MRTLSKCPVCDCQLGDYLDLCPQCGNSEVEDLDIVDADEVEKYRKRLDEKRAVWSALVAEQQRLADTLDNEVAVRADWEARLQTATKDVGDLERQINVEGEKRKDLTRQIERLVNETL